MFGTRRFVYSVMICMCMMFFLFAYNYNFAYLVLVIIYSRASWWILAGLFGELTRSTEELMAMPIPCQDMNQPEFPHVRVYREYRTANFETRKMAYDYLFKLSAGFGVLIINPQFKEALVWYANALLK